MQATNSAACELADDLPARLRKFRFAKTTNTTALILKIDRENLNIVEEELCENVTVEKLAEDLPENQPRFVVLSYKYDHADGRVLYPLVLLYYTPPVSTQLNMLYASSKTYLQEQAGLSKVFEVRDRDDLTTEWLREKLAI